MMDRALRGALADWSTRTIVAVVIGVGAGTAFAGDRITGKPFATRSAVYATSGMAATSQPLATQAAISILKQGGSAVDAAIAANAVLALVEPTGCGLGGDLFAIVWDADAKKLHGLNGSGRSPASLTLTEFERRGLQKIPSHGPLPVTVPGCVDGWFELHAKFGKLPMAEVLAPAIGYARDGFPVSDLIAYYWKLSVPRLSKWDGFTKQFTIDGRAPEVGEIFRNPHLAKTLGLLATEGRDAFYKGPIAEAIDAQMKRVGGFLTKADLAAHTSEWVEPVSTTYRGVEVFELPPNGQGIAALQMLNLLEQRDVRAMGFESPEFVHWFVEAKKLAFADRARFYADPAFAPVPVEQLISKGYAKKRIEGIDPERAALSVEAGTEVLEHGDTIYLAAADSSGMMVSLIQSNYRGMGSGLAPEGCGFILQDRGELFALDAEHPNGFAPRKRPFHTIIPAFARKPGEWLLAFGIMGGATQPQAHAQVICNLVDFDLNLQEAGDAARIVHTGSSQPTGEVMSDGGAIALESAFDAMCRAKLGEWGHKVSKARGLFGGYQAVMRDLKRGVLVGASESRKDGHAAGY